MEKKSHIVLGLAYGDEGKGVMTSNLAKSMSNSLVIRFSGGHQAGHTVIKDDYRHVFSSFGSGTLDGAHTYWSEYCTLYPKAFLNERKALVDNGFEPIFFVHPMAMITTPFDVWYNRILEQSIRHGSVGLGFGCTIERNATTPYKLYAVDLLRPTILEHKLRNIATYYQNRPFIRHNGTGGTTGSLFDPDELIELTMQHVEQMKPFINVMPLSEIKDNYYNFVFEGSQGIMLDQDFGYFPNVTRSYTTSRNAMQIIKDNGLPMPEVFYCMRSYLTRHGNGYMPNYIENMHFEDKTNKTHEYQGDFRQGHHSLEELLYAIKCDSSFGPYAKRTINISCLDQTDDKVLIDGEQIDATDGGRKHIIGTGLKEKFNQTEPDILFTTNEMWQIARRFTKTTNEKTFKRFLPEIETFSYH